MPDTVAESSAATVNALGNFDGNSVAMAPKRTIKILPTPKPRVSDNGHRQTEPIADRSRAGHWPSPGLLLSEGIVLYIIRPSSSTFVAARHRHLCFGGLLAGSLRRLERRPGNVGAALASTTRASCVLPTTTGCHCCRESRGHQAP